MYDKETITLVTGGFDPLHSGHIAYLKEASKLGDKLVVGLNSDEWLTRKKGRPFLNFQERAEILESLEMVDSVLSFDDSDGSARGAIFKLKSTEGYGKKIIFANGGDRDNTNTPELVTYGEDPQVEFAYGVGGYNKKNSSRWILEEWKQPKVQRKWGWYRVLQDRPGYKIKELVMKFLNTYIICICFPTINNSRNKSILTQNLFLHYETFGSRLNPPLLGVQ